MSPVVFFLNGFISHYSMSLFRFHVLFFLLCNSIVFAQLSPGDLTQAHSGLEGLSNCTKCHTLGKQIENAKCLSCHSELHKLISSHRGYHASSEVSGKKCESCHSEHHGRNFKIVRFNKDKFNHDLSGFKLTGKHIQTACDKCHQVKNIKSKISKKSGFSYLGLQQDCASCHTDFHKGSLGNNCSTCHSTDAFKPAKSFDHTKAKFQLTGSHLQVACEKCHPKSTENGTLVQKFKGLLFSNCTPCHRDVHDGKLGIDCKSCHNTGSFTRVATQNFDHNRTAFPLIGKHTTVACKACHGTKNSLRMKHDACTDCHKDKHNRQFLKADGTLTNCSECHSVNGFSPSLFSVDRHNTAKFTLSGSHLSLPCASCHKSDNTWNFVKKHDSCTDCHENAHGTEITGTYLGNNNCLKCHETGSWQEITFDHNSTPFRLTGRHAQVSCNQCHKRDNQKFMFKSLLQDCIQCHKDVHAGQFIENKTTNCLRCHTFDNWRPTKFDHNLTKFMLTGAHAKVPCFRCHKQVTNSSTVYIQYRIEEFKCANCHS